MQQDCLYAHHRDDVIETMMMSLFYEGRFHSFSPLPIWTAWI